MAISDAADQVLIDELNTALPHMIPVVAGMGLRVLEAGRGRAVTAVPFEGNGNHLGSMYAGVLFTVSEFLGGLIATTSFDAKVYYPLAKDFQITFIKPAKSEVRASAELDEGELNRIAGEAAANGKSDFVLSSEIVDADGTVVATTTGRFQLRAHRR